MAPLVCAVADLVQDEVAVDGSSLVQQRVNALQDSHHAGILIERCPNAGADESSLPTAADSAPISAKCSKKPLTGLQRRKQRLKSVPIIDCNLVTSTSHEASPFLRSDPQGIRKHYEVYEPLGQGTTGVVFRASRRSDGQQVALKMMRMNDEELLNIAKQEYELLRSIEHPHIIQALDFFTYPFGAVLVLSFFAGKTLEVSVQEAPDRHFSEETSLRLFSRLVLAVDHLHTLNIIHRDVKASNVLVDGDLLDLRLVDFNTAQRVIDGGALTMTGTVDYLPPEVLLGDSLSEKSDVWAMGLCLQLMLSGTLPIERRLFSSRGGFAEAMIAKEVHLDGEGWQHVSELAKTVLRACLEIQPSCRATASQILASDWLGSHKRYP